MTSIARTPAGAATTNERQVEGWKVGAAVGGLAGIASFQRTLMARPPLHQVGITAAALGIGYGVGVGANALARGLDGATGLEDGGAHLALAGIGAAGVVATTIASRGQSNIPLSVARTASALVGVGGLAGAALIGEQRVVDAIKDSTPGGAATAHVALLGAGAVGAGALMLATRRPGAMSGAAELAYQRTLANVPKASATPIPFDRAAAELLDTQRATMTTTSGRAADSFLPLDRLDAQGKRFLAEVTPPEEIHRVMGGSADAVRSPFRIYGGLAHADSHKQLVANAIKEAGSLKDASGRTALDSGTVIINIPSGTGYVAPPQVAAAEYLTRGDVTSIALQYHNKPSIQSTGKVPDAAKLFDEAITQLVPAIRARPNGADTKIVVYSESLGAWAVQNALRKDGADAVSARGFDTLINAGTPRFSRFRTDNLGFAGHSMDPSGKVIEFDNLAQLEGLPADKRAGLNAFLFSHYDDPVTRWTPTQLVEPPPFLTDAAHATGIPPKMKWYPIISGVQGVVDSANGASLPRGILGSRGHDYRGDIVPVLANALDKPASRETLEQVITATNQAELAFLDRTEAAAKAAQAAKQAAAG